jgi:hypothetical protein
MAVLPSASYSLTVPLQITNRPGMLRRVASAIVDLVESDRDTAVLGLGNIGPEAALPVMEGKAMPFKECFPGFFRGLLDSQARTVNDENVAPAVAEDVAQAAHATGVARRRRRRRADLTAAP